MTHFTRCIQTDFGHPEFSFNRIHTVSGVRYYIAVLDKNQRSCCFSMETRAGHWFIIVGPKLPSWILGLEGVLAEAITDHNPFGDN